MKKITTFEEHLDTQYGKKGTPKREIFEIACKKADVKLEDSYYVGDEFELDVNRSVNAGMRGVLVDRYARFANGCSEYVIRDLRQLKKVIGA